MDKPNSNENRNKNTKKIISDKGDCDMAILTKPSNTMILIDKDKTKSFLEDYKKNLIKPSFLKKCIEFNSNIHKGIDSDKNR